MMNKIQKLDNKLIQAQILAYLIGNKKVSKILKSTYIKHFTKLFDELPKYYKAYQYEVDIKKFFNGSDESNNIIPNFISTNNYIDYSVTLNYTIKNKHLVESILSSYNIEISDDNFKFMKKILSGKVVDFEFSTMDENKVVICSSELEDKDISKKCFKEELCFSLPNSKIGCDIQTYPLVFTHITTNNSTLQFNIFAEEDISKIEHYTIPKLKINKFLNSIG